MFHSLFTESGVVGHHALTGLTAVVVVVGIVGALRLIMSFFRLGDVKWADIVGVGYMQHIRGVKGTNEFLERNFPGEDELKRSPRVTKVNPVVHALVYQAKMKYGNMTPKPENGFIIRDFMNLTISNWRKKALLEQERDRVMNINDSLPDLPVNAVDYDLRSAEDLPQGRDVLEQDEYDEMFMVWNILKTTRKYDLVGIAAKATAMYFVLTTDEEDVHHVLASKVIRAQYASPQ